MRTLPRASRPLAESSPRDLPGQPDCAPLSRLRGDVAALAILLVIILIAAGFRFLYDNWLAQWDILGYFLPNYAYVGQRLRSLQIPAWNPYFSSGTPMAGDAEGGWMYLPAMLTFALFNVAMAMKLMVLLQALIGGLATYLFARRLGLLPLAALFAAVTLAIGPALYDVTGQSTVVGQIAFWVPVGMLGAEAALTAVTWQGRIAWAGLGGVGVVEMFAAWPQGCLYGCMLVGGWLAYRGLVFFQGSRQAELRRAVIVGAVIAAFTVTLGAAAILPRLEFNAESTIGNGDYSQLLGGNYVAKPMSWLGQLGLYLQTSYYWRIIEFNIVVLLLGVLAIILGRTRYGIPFFTGTVLLFLDLAATTSFTRPIFDLIPYFSQLHDHRPTAATYMVYLPFAMLAGIGVQLLLTAPPGQRAWLWRLLPLPILLYAISVVQRHGAVVSSRQAELAVLATGLIVLTSTPLPALLPWPLVRRYVPQILAIALLGLSLLYPTGRDFVWAIRDPTSTANNLLSRNPTIDQAVQTMLSRRDPGTAADLLQYLQTTQPPFRYAAYFGTGSADDPHHTSTAMQTKPAIVAILANARSSLLNLEQISGYNPLHLKYYSDYVEWMNMVIQNYHWLDVYAHALSSQLLDMLNVRYVLVPTSLKHAPPIPDGEIIYQDDLVTVYENQNAFPRAWLVHEIRPDENDAALSQLANARVNAHTVAFVEGPVPAASGTKPQHGPTIDPPDAVKITTYQPETIGMQVTAKSNGLLVISEPYAKGWTASVDGKTVPVLRTDYALQGIPVTAGTHTVVLTYAPRSLSIGLWLTGFGLLALLGVWLWAIAGWWQRR